jgi:hypothetical protein
MTLNAASNIQTRFDHSLLNLDTTQLPTPDQLMNYINQDKSTLITNISLVRFLAQTKNTLAKQYGIGEIRLYVSEKKLKAQQAFLDSACNVNPILFVFFWYAWLGKSLPAHFFWSLVYKVTFPPPSPFFLAYLVLFLFYLVFFILYVYICVVPKTIRYRSFPWNVNT